MNPILFGMVYRFTAATLSLLLTCFLGVSGEAESVWFYEDAIVVELDRSENDVKPSWQFGGFIFLRHDKLEHEYGHWLQEKALGPLYLPTAGLVSTVMQYRFARRGRYYRGWPESWADDLADGRAQGYWITLLEEIL